MELGKTLVEISAIMDYPDYDLVGGTDV